MSSANSPPHSADRVFSLQICGQPGHDYEPQWSTNLAGLAFWELHELQRSAVRPRLQNHILRSELKLPAGRPAARWWVQGSDA